MGDKWTPLQLPPPASHPPCPPWAWLPSDQVPSPGAGCLALLLPCAAPRPASKAPAPALPLLARRGTELRRCMLPRSAVVRTLGLQLCLPASGAQPVAAVSLHFGSSFHEPGFEGASVLLVVAGGWLVWWRHGGQTPLQLSAAPLRCLLL